MSSPELTPTSYIVLGLLEMMVGGGSPYDLKQVVAVSVGNFWSVPHSQLYRECERLEAEGLLDCAEERTPGGRPRKLYAVTGAGRKALAAWREDVGGERMGELRDPGLLKLFLGADPKRLAAAQLESHLRQLAEYEARAQAFAGGPPDGPRLTLEAGIDHERVWVRFWERLA